MANVVRKPSDVNFTKDELKLILDVFQERLNVTDVSPSRYNLIIDKIEVLYPRKTAC